MKFKERPEIPGPLLGAIKESIGEYSRELSDWYKEHGEGKYAISATALLQPVRERILKRRHFELIEHDPLDMIPALIGNVVHFVLEKAANMPKDNGEGYRYYAEGRNKVRMTIGDRVCIVHSKHDLLDMDTGQLQDWKVTSDTVIKYSEESHALQLNINRLVLQAKGYTVSSMENVYILKVNRSKDPFRIPNVLVVKRDEMPRDEVLAYVRRRIEANLAAEELSDFNLPECTPKEKWQRDNEYRVYFRKKGGRKGVIQDFSSRKAFAAPTLKEVGNYISDHHPSVDNADIKIDEFKGLPLKCLKFCDAAPFCSIHQKFLRDNPQFVHEEEESVD